MGEEKISADRLTAFSDAVFAVIVTIYAGSVRRAAHRLRSDLRRPDPPLAARGPWQSAVTVLQVNNL